MKDNGFIRLNGDEVREFIASPYPSCWYINTTTGETHTTPGSYDGTSPDGCAFLMDGPNPVWVFQWAGDWQRAADEQLNPLLSSAFPNPVTP